MQTHFCLILLLVVGVNAGQLRIYDNPLNGKAVDLFLLVDETNSRMNQMQLGQMKTPLKAIATYLQPPGSSPFFGAFFYGATSAVHTVVPFTTSSATTFIAKLDLKQYTTAQTSPSTLSLALDSVDALCRQSCRTNVPRVTVGGIAHSSVREQPWYDRNCCRHRLYRKYGHSTQTSVSS